MYSQIDGLPLHPLVVHAVVVLVPLATVGALLVAVRPRWSRAYGPLVAAVAVAGAGAAFVARAAGVALQRTLRDAGDPLEGIEDHSRWGLWVLVLGLAFAVVTVAGTVLARRDGPRGRPAQVTAWLSVGLGAAATAVTFLAGESGATSVWGYVYG